MKIDSGGADSLPALGIWLGKQICRVLHPDLEFVVTVCAKNPMSKPK